jgi:hypothetical protein
MSGFKVISYLRICRAFVKLDLVARGQICLFWYSVLARRHQGVAGAATHQQPRQTRSSSTARSSRSSAAYSAGLLARSLISQGLRSGAIPIGRRTEIPNAIRLESEDCEQRVVP